jgi:hypothetical protein
MTMKISLLIPFYIGFLFISLSIPLLLAMPETRRLRASESHEDQLDNSTNGPLPNYDRTTLSSDENFFSIARNRNIPLALSVMFVGAFRPASVAILLQYARTRFGWLITDTAFLVSEIAIVNIVLFLLVLPQVIAWAVSRWHVRAQMIDWNIVFSSLLILASGTMLIGVAPSSATLIPGMGP